MAFDQATRNKLQSFVSEARTLLTTEFTRQMQNNFGMDPDTGAISHLDSLPHLNDTQIQTARLLRDTKDHYQTSSPSEDSKQILDRIVREQAFTVLNRLCALRMTETRGILVESIGKAYNSTGFQLYTRVAGTSLGEIGDVYQTFLFSLFDEFAYDLTVLFDRYSPMGRLFPRESVLLSLLDKINAVALEALWAEDETIGWIYQYFNSVEERKKMRAESQAPRNSRELAVRNQFFTPRYVVEFLTDNTLGRIWYEMTKGNTRLTDQCRYLVRRPNEIFLQKGETAPEMQDTDTDLSQEELLNQRVYIEHRPIKDPRQILMLDPACGSMHFGLYAFDLFEKIYEEAWNLQSTGQWQGEVKKDRNLLIDIYANREDLLRDVPRLIIENNIHGVDIDPRAVQIAGLSLWLRAQRSWKEQNVKPGERSRILKSNIVCAEPMPGDREILKRFSKNLKPTVLGQLLEIIFEKMELAGEAGSLLKIEEEIESAVELAREAFNKEILLRNTQTGYLPGMAPEKKQLSLFDFADLSSKTQFWETAEEKILVALKDYAEHAEESDGGRRRLFAEDAAKGFAFIDICRKRYDVVLMNPPFGEIPERISDKIKIWFPYHSNNILTCLLSRSKQICDAGFIGSVIDRTILIKNSYETFRTVEFLDSLSLSGVVDLGWGVLDADVEVSSIVFSSGSNHNVFGINLSSYQKKETALKELTIKPVTLRHDTIKEFPFAAINLQIPIFFQNAIFNFKTLSESGCTFFNGHTIKSDVFKRLYWEVDLKYHLENIKRMWNGSGYSPFRVSFKECVVIKSFYEHSSTILRSPNKHGEAGLCFGKRGDFLDVQILPKGLMLTNEGFGGGINKDQAFIFLSFLNSIVGQFSINLYCGQHKGVGYVNKLPFPKLNASENSKVLEFSKNSYTITQEIQILCETDHLFYYLFPPSVSNVPNRLKEFLLKKYEQLNELIFKIDKLICEIYSINSDELSIIETTAKHRSQIAPYFEYTPSKKSPDSILSIIYESILSYSIGVIFARWDIRYATGEKEAPELPDPFDPLPTCPPNMLQNSSGLPAEPNDIPDDYPLRITWSGIIVDDEGHPEDILTRVRDVMEVIWKDKAGDIEQEACEILGIESLREYFSKPSKFFADHLKRYSKSRRQAPIYWPLSTPSGSYALWLYYHRLTDQTLYKCVNDFVEPKLKQVSNTAEVLQRKTGRSHEEEQALEKYLDLALEISDFRDELLRIAGFWKPNLNDGVQITAAPLWKLFQHRPWQNKLKQTWKLLEKGEYDWAHLAYAVWPERVIRASHKDRSYAIAHDLEEDLWEEIENGIDRQGNLKYKWVPKELSDQEIKKIISRKLP